MNSREKGKRGERQWRDELRSAGYMARRGQQFYGSPDSPDVICDDLNWLHFEVKCVERLNIEDAMDQARRDAGKKAPVVAHRRSFCKWLVTMEASTFFQMLQGMFPIEQSNKEYLYE
jgi:Holliday junction resolvase